MHNAGVFVPLTLNSLYDNLKSVIESSDDHIEFARLWGTVLKTESTLREFNHVQTENERLLTLASKYNRIKIIQFLKKRESLSPVNAISHSAAQTHPSENSVQKSTLTKCNFISPDISAYFTLGNTTHAAIIAVKTNDLVTLKRLVRHVSFDPSLAVEAETQRSLLHLAVLSNDNGRCLEYLLSTRRFSINGQDHQRCTPLHLAIERENISAVSSLLSVDGVDGNAESELGSPLQLAITKGNPFIVKALIECIEWCSLDLQTKLANAFVLEEYAHSICEFNDCTASRNQAYRNICGLLVRVHTLQLMLAADASQQRSFFTKYELITAQSVLRDKVKRLDWPVEISQWITRGGRYQDAMPQCSS